MTAIFSSNHLRRHLFSHRRPTCSSHKLRHPSAVKREQAGAIQGERGSMTTFDATDRTRAVEFPFPPRVVFRAVAEAISDLPGMTFHEFDQLIGPRLRDDCRECIPGRREGGSLRPRRRIRSKPCADHFGREDRLRICIHARSEPEERRGDHLRHQQGARSSWGAVGSGTRSRVRRSSHASCCRGETLAPRGHLRQLADH